MSVWEFYQERERECSRKFPDSLANCELAIENLWYIKIKTDRDFDKKAKEIPKEWEPYKQYISLFFQRNISYLIASYKLTRQGLVNPSYCILRTVYEQILRSVFFYHFHDEAQLLYDFQNEINSADPSKKEELRKKIASTRYWNHQYMIDKLFKGEIKESHKQFYDTISWYSHPNIRSAFNDFYVTKSVDDLTKIIQDLCFNSMDIFQITFHTMLSQELNRFIEENKNLIGTNLKKIGVYKPNKAI